MFRRELKTQFNENKYNMLTQKGKFNLTSYYQLGVGQRSHLKRVPFQKHVIGTVALVVIGFNYTKRFYTFPHHHHEAGEPFLLANGELNPFDTQPQYCQFDTECTSGCCYNEACHDYNTCSIMTQIAQFENANYCKLDLDCNSGTGNAQSNTYCCFEQKCVQATVCIQHYYVPLIVGGVFSIILAAVSSILINRCLSKQAERIKQEMKIKQRRDNIRKQKAEMKKLLGEEGYQKYREEHPDAFSLKDPQQNKEEEKAKEIKSKPVENTNNLAAQQLTQQQQQIQHYNFIKMHMMSNPQFLKLDPQQQHQQILMIMQQQLIQQQQMKQQQQQNFQQMQQSVQQQKKQAPNPIVNSSQQLQPKKSQQIISQQQQQIRASQQSVGQQSQINILSSVNLSQNSKPPQVQVEASQDNGPKFYGKQNPNLSIVQAQNPLYPDYKPNVPNPGKLQENIVKPNNPALSEINQKRSILASNRRPLAKHITSQIKEGPLPM